MLEFTAQRLEKKRNSCFSPVVSSDRLSAYSNMYMATPRDEHAADILVAEIVKKYRGEKIKILTTKKNKK